MLCARLTEQMRLVRWVRWERVLVIVFAESLARRPSTRPPAERSILQSSALSVILSLSVCLAVYSQLIKEISRKLVQYTAHFYFYTISFKCHRTSPHTCFVPSSLGNIRVLHWGQNRALGLSILYIMQMSAAFGLPYSQARTHTLTDKIMNGGRCACNAITAEVPLWWSITLTPHNIMVDPIKTYYLRTKPPTPSRRCTGPKFVAERWVEPGHIVCLVALPHSMPGAPRLQRIVVVCIYRTQHTRLPCVYVWVSVCERVCPPCGPLQRQP